MQINSRALLGSNLIATKNKQTERNSLMALVISFKTFIKSWKVVMLMEAKAKFPKFQFLLEILNFIVGSKCYIPCTNRLTSFSFFF